MLLAMTNPLPKWILGTAIIFGGCAKGTIAMPQDIPYQPSDDDDDNDDGASDTDNDASSGTTQAEPDTSGQVSESWEGTTGSESGGTAAMITHGGSSEDSGGSSGDGQGTSTTAPAEQQPASGWWSHCTSNAECDQNLVCVLGSAPDDGYCAAPCTPAGDATSCGGGQGIGVPSCFTQSGVSVCALDCSTTACPAPMNCITDTVESGPIQICI